MKSKIKRYFESLKPEKLGLKDKIKVSSVKLIGTGANNSNFLVIANKKKFTFRLNMLINSRTKTRSEFRSLKLIENLGIAPKAWILDDSRKIFDSDFTILDYIEGKSLNQKKYVIDSKLIRGVVKLMVKLHSMPLRGALLKLPKDENNYQDLLNKTKKHINLKELDSNKKLLKIMKESYEGLKDRVPKKEKHPLVFTQGDICDENIVTNKGELKLIDFEGMVITDPASDIAYTLTQFGEKDLNERQRKKFLDEYLKLRKDSTLRKRVKIFIPLKNFIDLSWAISQVLKIRDKRIHKSFIKKNTLKDALVYAQKVFGRCIKDGTISGKYKDIDLKEELK